MNPLNNKQKRELALDLAILTYWQVAMKFGIDKYYKSKRSAIAFVRKTYLDVKSRPNTFKVPQETLDNVQKALDSRNRKLLGGEIMIRPDQTPEKPKEEFQEFDNKELVALARKGSWILLNRKLQMVAKSPKQLKNTTLAALANVAGITFDKDKIAKGEATERILLLAKIDDGMTKEEKLSLILTQRERINTQKPEVSNGT